MTTNSLRQKLLLCQEEIGAIKRDSTNPFFKSKYFDINAVLAEVKPILNKHGLILMQSLTTHETGRIALKTSIMDADGVDAIIETCVLPEGKTAQETGSVITYYRRYALQSMLALEATDDDANSARGKKLQDDDLSF